MTTESLIAQATTTNEGHGVLPVVGGQPAQGADDQATQGTQTEGQSVGDKPTEQSNASESTDKLQGAPEKYEFVAPQGVTYDDVVIGQFSEIAKELNLPQDSAQRILDKVAPVIQARQNEALVTARSEWEQASKSDKEFGGPQIMENLAVANKALNTFGTPELRSMLNESGLGNHPEVIRLLYRAGKAISEDNFVGSGQKGTSTAGDPQKLFSKSNMNP